MFSELFPSIQYLRHHGVYRALQQKLAVSLFSCHFFPLTFLRPSLLSFFAPTSPVNPTICVGENSRESLAGSGQMISSTWEFLHHENGKLLILSAVATEYTHSLTYSTTNPTCFSTMRLTDDVPVILTTVSFMELFMGCEVGHKVSNDNAQRDIWNQHVFLVDFDFT